MLISLRSSLGSGVIIHPPYHSVSINFHNDGGEHAHFPLVAPLPPPIVHTVVVSVHELDYRSLREGELLVKLGSVLILGL